MLSKPRSILVFAILHLDRLGFEVSGRISLSPTDARYRFLPEHGAEPGLGGFKTLVKHTGDKQRPCGRGYPRGRCGGLLNISHRGAGLKSHADDKLINPATRPCLTAPKLESRGKGIARRLLASGGLGPAAALLRPTRGVLLEPATKRQVRTGRGRLELNLAHPAKVPRWSPFSLPPRLMLES